MKRLTAILAIFLLAATAALPAQESRPAPEQGPSAPASPASREAARKLLDRVIASQLGNLDRGSIRSFQGRFQFRLFREKDELVGDYAQAWCFDEKGLFHFRRTLATDYSRNVVTLVCNDLGDDKDQIFGIDRKGRTIAKNRAEDEQDRDNIRIEKRSALRLYELFFLNELDIDETSLELVSEKEKLALEIGFNSAFAKEVKVVALSTREGRRIRLFIDDGDKTCDIVQAEVLDPRDPRLETGPDGVERPVAEVYQMLIHWQVAMPDSEKKVRFPLRMRYLLGTKPILEITCDDPTEVRLNSIDRKLRKKLFEPEE